jgi:hypothetical protein
MPTPKARMIDYLRSRGKTRTDITASAHGSGGKDPELMDNKIRLRSYRTYNVIAELDLCDHGYNLSLPNPRNRQGCSAVPKGFFDIISGSSLGFFVDNGEIFICIDGNVIPLTPDLSCSLIRNKNINTLAFQLPGGDETVFEYRPDTSDVIAGDTTQGIDEESFDLVLLLYNIVKNPGRQGVLIECYSG